MDLLDNELVSWSVPGNDQVGVVILVLASLSVALPLLLPLAFPLAFPLALLLVVCMNN